MLKVHGVCRGYIGKNIRIVEEKMPATVEGLGCRMIWARTRKPKSTSPEPLKRVLGFRGLGLRVQSLEFDSYLALEPRRHAKSR